ncbi:hypothetical protein BH23CHL2_BH23CHL2_00980 [soil metagenome]
MHRRTGWLELRPWGCSWAHIQASAVALANEHFQRTWARTDLLVVSGQVSLTWMWGPDWFTGELQEHYADFPGGQRSVQYFDKVPARSTEQAIMDSC